MTQRGVERPLPRSAVIIKHLRLESRVMRPCRCTALHRHTFSVRPIHSRHLGSQKDRNRNL